MIVLCGATGCAETSLKEQPQFRKLEPSTGQVITGSPKQAETAPEPSQEPATTAETPAPEAAAAPTSAEPPETRVALLLPLTGTNAALGQAMLEAAQMSLFDLANKSFVLMPFDTGETEDGARAAATAAVEQKAQLILGPLLATSVRAVAPIAKQAGIPVVSFSNSREVAGDGVFILGFVPRQQVAAVVNYAASGGASRFAVLAPDNDYGHAVVDAARDTVQERGGTLVRARLYDPAAKDYTGLVKDFSDYDARHGALVAQRRALEAKNDEVSRQALRRLNRLDTVGNPPFDALILPESGERLRTLSALLSYFDIDIPQVKFLGLRSWDVIPNLGTEPALIGAWYCGSPAADRDNFIAGFKQAFGYQPPRLTSLAYDATALAAILGQGENGPDYSVSALTDRRGFLGVDGIFRLDPDGIAERAFAIYEVTRDGVTVRRTAPTSFEHLTN